MNGKQPITLVLVSVMVGLFAFSFVGFAPVARAQVATLTDCPNFGAITSASSGNPGTGFSVTFSGTTSQQYFVTEPSNGNLIEICVYPNGGSVTSASSESTPVPNWHAGTNCKGGGVDTCAFAERNTGTATLTGAFTNKEVLDVTYSSAPTTLLIALHVSQDSGSGICGAGAVPDPDVQGNPLTCFIIPSGGVFPPPPPPGVPQFPIGMGLVLIAMAPVLFFMKKRISPVN